MKKALIIDLLNKLEDEDLIQIACEFDIFSNDDSDDEDDFDTNDDFDFGNRRGAIEYISTFIKPSSLKNKKSREAFLECIGNLIAYTKFNDLFNCIAQKLKLETGINPTLGFNDYTYDRFRFPLYKEICSLFIDTSNIIDERQMIKPIV